MVLRIETSCFSCFTGNTLQDVSTRIPPSLTKVRQFAGVGELAAARKSLTTKNATCVAFVAVCDAY